VVVGVDLETATNASLWATVGVVLLALAAVWLVKQVVTKVLTVAVLLALAFVVWSQRAELVDCADRVRDTLAAGAHDDTTCTFFGQDVTIPGRDSLLGPEDAGTTTTTTVA
jgi:hypothetical protein